MINFWKIPKQSPSVIHNLRVPFDIDGDAFAVLVVADPKLRSNKVGPIRSAIEFVMEFGSIDLEFDKLAPIGIGLHDLPTLVDIHQDRIMHVLIEGIMIEFLANEFPRLQMFHERFASSFMRRGAESSIVGIVRSIEFQFAQQGYTSGTIHPPLSARGA